jgi:tRNA(Ile)-lysidine synthase
LQAGTAAKVLDFAAFAAIPEEIRVRLLQRAIDRFGHEGPAELGKVEALLSALEQAGAQKVASRGPKLKQTLAGAMITLAGGRLRIEPAPPRRRRG